MTSLFIQVADESVIHDRLVRLRTNQLRRKGGLGERTDKLGTI